MFKNEKITANRYIKYISKLSLVLPLLSSFLSFNTQAIDFEFLLSNALERHPSIQRNSTLLYSSKEALSGAKWQYYPTPAISSEYQINRNSSSGESDYVTTLSLSQPLWAGGRISNTVQQAKDNVSLSKAELRVAKESLGFEVIAAYSQWMSGHNAKIIMQENVTLHRNLAEQLKRRVDTGVSSESDLLLATSRLSGAEADYTVSEATETRALFSLRQLSTLNVKSENLNAELPDLKKLNEKLVFSEAKQLSPQLEKLRQEIAVNKSGLAIQKSKYYPQVNLVGAYETGNDVFGHAQNDFNISIQLTSQFGAGLSTMSGVNSASYQIESSKYALLEGERRLQQTIENEFTLLNASDVRIESLQSSLANNEAVYKSYLRQFLAGNKSWLDVMNSVRDLVNTKSQLANTKAELYASYLRLRMLSEGIDSF